MYVNSQLLVCILVFSDYCYQRFGYFLQVCAVIHVWNCLLPVLCMLWTDVELVVKQLKLSAVGISSSAENTDEVNKILSELQELVPKVKDISLSAKRSAPVADCNTNVVLCSSRF